MIRLSRLWLLLPLACACSTGKSQGAGGGETQLGPGSGGADGGGHASGSSSGGSAGTEAGAGEGGRGGIQLPGRQCGLARCDGRLTCCTAADTCGKPAPAQIFRATCVDATPRGGALSESCPDSREFCQRSLCTAFRGCTLATSTVAAPACGYWVEGWDIVGGEEALQVTAQLGCVAPEEFVSP